MESTKELKILFVHNEYASPSGEEQASNALAEILRENGHEVIWYIRKSSEIKRIFPDQIKAFFTGIYNPFSISDIRKTIEKNNPDLIQIQNVYPLISPSIFKPISSEGIPIVMRCPNYRLFCPTGLFFDSNGSVCEKCTDQGHEIWCIRKNCSGSIAKSTAYALRNLITRISGVFLKYADIIIVQSEFQRKKFIKLGVPDNKIEVLPGITPTITVSSVRSDGSYITFVGRVSSEKGIDDFLSAARRLPDLKFAIAGNIPEGNYFKMAPGNVEWKGFLKEDDLNDLYSQSAVIIVPSRWYEGFPNVITRAMYHSKPVITTDSGCFPEIIDHGINGFMYPSGNIDLLVSYIQSVIQNPATSVKMGQNGLEKAEREYSQKIIYEKLINIYSRTLEISRKRVD